VYETISDGEWKITDVDNSNRVNLPAAMGDPSGFYISLSKDPVVLRVNRQMRQEALPLLYRRISFRLDDMDDLIKFLIALGWTSRDGIKSFGFLGRADQIPNAIRRISGF
jgi:hypothetical protein